MLLCAYLALCCIKVSDSQNSHISNVGNKSALAEAAKTTEATTCESNPTALSVPMGVPDNAAVTAKGSKTTPSVLLNVVVLGHECACQHFSPCSSHPCTLPNPVPMGPQGNFAFLDVRILGKLHGAKFTITDSPMWSVIIEKRLK